nr:MAG TPA: hypothetical protein [Caudoviricetes sp.]
MLIVKQSFSIWKVIILLLEISRCGTPHVMDVEIMVVAVVMGITVAVWPLQA